MFLLSVCIPHTGDLCRCVELRCIIEDDDVTERCKEILKKPDRSRKSPGRRCGGGWRRWTDRQRKRGERDEWIHKNCCTLKRTLTRWTKNNPSINGFQVLVLMISWLPLQSAICSSSKIICFGSHHRSIQPSIVIRYLVWWRRAKRVVSDRAGSFKHTFTHTLVHTIQ